MYPLHVYSTHPTHLSLSLFSVTPIGNKPGQITREAIAEAEASEDLDDDDIFSGKPSDWEYDASTEEVGHDSEEAEAGREGFRDEGDEGDENPPTPILDAYEKSRDPAEMERLIALAFDSLPERAGPQRYNHKRREHQRYRTIRVSELSVFCVIQQGWRGPPKRGKSCYLNSLHLRMYGVLRSDTPSLVAVPGCGVDQREAKAASHKQPSRVKSMISSTPLPCPPPQIPVVPAMRPFCVCSQAASYNLFPLFVFLVMCEILPTRR